MQAKSTGRLPDQHDFEIGARIRLRRRLLGVSQSTLAEQVGLTFQQVQKYERGANRVAASMLGRIAAALQCSASFLMGESNPAAVPDVAPAPGRDDTRRMLDAFEAIADDDLRRKIADFVVGLASHALGPETCTPLAEAVTVADAPTPVATRTAKPVRRASRSPKKAVPLRPPEAKVVAMTPQSGEPGPSDKTKRPPRVRGRRAAQDPVWRRRSKRKDR